MSHGSMTVIAFGQDSSALQESPKARTSAVAIPPLVTRSSLTFPSYSPQRPSTWDCRDGSTRTITEVPLSHWRVTPGIFAKTHRPAVEVSNVLAPLETITAL